MKQFVTLNKLAARDRVAVISPSAGLPGLFPWVYELGLKRIEQKFNLRVKEYPTTRTMNAALKDRARDIMAAFADTENKAIIASIGGEDEIQLLKYLDTEVLKANPKPFLGYSDNTHLHNMLWSLGIPSYYGGSVMTQFAMQGRMHEMTIKSIEHALFKTGKVKIEPAKEFTDIGLRWEEPANLLKNREHEVNEGWFWDGKGQVEGVLWGGCIESLIAQFAVGKYLPDEADLDGIILFLETAEDIPESWLVSYLLVGMGERGWFDRLKAVLVGRPKAWEYDKQNSYDEKRSYKNNQRNMVIKTIRTYNRSLPIVQNLDFGHTDPQILLPMGRKAYLNSEKKSIELDY